MYSAKGENNTYKLVIGTYGDQLRAALSIPLSCEEQSDGDSGSVTISFSSVQIHPSSQLIQMSSSDVGGNYGEIELRAFSVQNGLEATLLSVKTGIIANLVFPPPYRSPTP